MAAGLINMQVAHSAKHAQIFPFLCHDGRLPTEFNGPRTVETMRVLDSMYKLCALYNQVIYAED